ncbi:hypothetical protein H9P43_001271 [Blastocladiella emersonii ATCC 22665]|nr:hypothetical protein H9P43_001271 [Blastocladiella emersonii ATCC 22665]
MPTNTAPAAPTGPTHAIPYTPSKSGIVTTAHPPPPLTPAEVAKQYPASLELKLVQFVHRHGERTPVWPGLQHLVPPNHDDCLMGNFLALQADPGPVAHQLYRKSTLNAATWEEGIPDAHVQKTPSLATCYHGQLTDRGRTTLSSIGASLRDLYVGKLGFLPSTFADPALVYLRSTDYPRTLESLHSLMLGLYPPASRTATDALHIFTRTPSGRDNVYPDHECARYMHLRKQFTALIKSDLRAREYPSWPADLRAMLDEKYGPVLAFDVLGSALAHDWPVNVTPADFERLRAASSRLWFDHMAEYPVFPKLMLGRFVTELHELQHHVVAGKPPTPDPEFSMHLQHVTERHLVRDSGVAGPAVKLAPQLPKFAVYSAHDTTMAPLLGALGLWHGEHRYWPLFASHVTIETFRAKGAAAAQSSPEDAHYVRVKYNDRATTLPACAAPGDHHPDDRSLCTYRAFHALVKSVATTRKEHAMLCKKVNVA